MPTTFTLDVNGQQRRARCEPGTPLLYVLRNDLLLNGPRFGCGLGQCGSCTVTLDGTAVRSCVLPVEAVGTAKVVTLEGLATRGRPHPLQAAFVHEQAAQCGYCTNGMIMAAKALLDRQPKPTESAVREALDPHVCRCGVHNRIVAAVLRASREI